MRAQSLPFHVPEIGDENVGTNVPFIPLHLHPFYRDAFTYRPRDFPNVSTVYERLVSLPIYHRMTEDDVQDVIDAIRKIVNVYRR
jgi:dTDP-4-amino-4,6-dideoxygalactose transaminase